MKIEQLIKASPLYKPTKKIVLYRGVASPSVLFVGEAPGRQEDKVGKPFVGRSGDLLNEWIEHYHLTKIFGVSNALPLIPLNEHNQIRKPSLEEINYFKPVLHEVLMKKKPKIVVCLGDTACTSILHRPISLCRDRSFYNPRFYVTAQYHPSYFLRQGKDGIAEFAKTYEIIKDVLKLKEDINRSEVENEENKS